MTFGKRVWVDINYENYTITGKYSCSGYEQLDTEEKLMKICKSYKDRKTDDLINLFIKDLEYKFGIQISYIITYTSTVSADLESKTYTIKVALVPDTVAKINRSIKRNKEKNEPGKMTVASIASRLYESYKLKMAQLCIHYAIFSVRKRLNYNDILNRLKKYGEEKTQKYIQSNIDGFTLERPNIYYLMDKIAFTFNTDGRAKVYTLNEFVNNFGELFYIALDNTGNFKPLRSTEYSIASIKSFEDLYIRLRDKDNRHKLKAIKNGLFVDAILIERDSNGKLRARLVGTNLNIPDNYDSIIKDGCTKADIISNIIDKEWNDYGRYNSGYDEITDVLRMASRLGIQKGGYGKCEGFTMEVLSKFKASDIKEVVNFINYGPKVEINTSYMAKEANLKCIFDTAYIQFTVNTYDYKPEDRVKFIKEHSKSLGILAREALLNQEEFRKQGLGLKFYSCTGQLNRDGTLEYIFTLKKSVYDLVNKQIKSDVQ